MILCLSKNLITKKNKHVHQEPDYKKKKKFLTCTAREKYSNNIVSRQRKKNIHVTLCHINFNKENIQYGCNDPLVHQNIFFCDPRNNTFPRNDSNRILFRNVSDHEPSIVIWIVS
jgi:hypothetical protein